MSKIITREYKIFTYNELSKESQAKVLENLHETNVDNEWYEFDYETFYEDLEAMGFEGAEIFFSGFWSQGDGASFTATLNIDKLAKHFSFKKKYAQLLKTYEIIGAIKRTGNYYHSNTMFVETESERKDGKDMYTHTTEQDNLEELILELARIEADKIYKGLEKTYNYLTSQVAIEETIAANEYTFLEDGTIFNE